LCREGTTLGLLGPTRVSGLALLKAVYLPEDRAFIRYTEIPGDDPPLLWLHGWMCSSTGELLPAAVEPQLRGRHQLLIDLLGHGYSDRPLGFGYTFEDHARTIVAVIDDLALTECGVIGHSMGGGVGILVAAARPHTVSLLIMAEGNLGGEPHAMTTQSEQEFVDRGFADLLESQTKEAEAQPKGLRAAHIGITRLVAPYALHREAAAMERETEPPLRPTVKTLQIPRWYLDGAKSDASTPRDDLEAAGVAFAVVPDTGHAMGLENPHGLAQTIADLLAQSWER
jgi:pimeloyl-ACP methyl ester carboxylesterase